MTKLSSRKQKAALFVVATAIFLDMLIYGLVVPILPEYAVSLGASQTDIGLLFGSYAVAMFVATPICGALSDRIGRRGPLLWGLLGLAAATLLFAFADSYWLLVAARILQGIAAAVTWTSGLALLADLYPSEQRGKALGIALSGQAAGILLGPTVGGWLYQLGGYALPFLFAAGLALIDGIVRLVLLRDLPDRKSEGHLSPLSLMRSSRLLIVAGVVMIGASVPSILEPTLPLHLKEKFQAEPGFVGMLFAVPTLTYGLATPLIGKLSNRFGHRITISLGLILIAISLPLAAWPTSMWMQAASMALLGVSMGTVLAASLPALADIADNSGQSSYGVTFAVYNTAYSIGMMLGPIGGGALADRLGLSYSYAVWGAVAALYLLAVQRLGSRRGVPERKG